MSPDRARYGAEQSTLLGALRRAAPVPEGFDPDDLRAAGGSLLRKRAGAVARAWPALALSLGEDFPVVFEGFARSSPPPAAGDGAADGLAFAATLDRAALSEDARVELALARGAFKLRRGAACRRRGPYVAACVERRPARLLVIVHVPGVGVRHVAVTLAPRRH